jgi:hypothetical protein
MLGMGASHVIALIYTENGLSVCLVFICFVLFFFPAARARSGRLSHAHARTCVRACVHIWVLG